ncbi:MAG: type IX secretion system sortase PorU [Saprospiraceae bacterium]|nr:type IX secretion system sortase PorU [Saprospiraceae bacterium]
MKNQLLLLLLLGAATVVAQTPISVQRTLQWQQKPGSWTTASGQEVEVWKFENCTYGDEARSLPLYSERFPISGKSELSARVVDVEWEPFNKKTSSDDAFLTDNLQVQVFHEQERASHFSRLKVVPVRKNGSAFERAISFKIEITAIPQPLGTGTEVQSRGFTTNSVLGSGTVYKFGVEQSGIYKLDYNFLKNDLGISDIDNIDPKSIKLYGNGGLMLPEKNSDIRPDDLLENAIEVVGEADGKFNTGDYILFYAVGPRTMQYRASATDPQLTTRVNLYDTHAWYFLVTGAGSGARISEQNSVAATYVTEQFDDFARLEEEKTNLLNFNSSSQGSGKRWFGDYFYQSRTKNYTFDFPNYVPDSLARLRAEFVGRSDVGQTVRFEAAGTTLSKSVGAVDVDNGDGPFASNATVVGNFKPNADQVQVTVSYPEVNDQSEGWLDYIELNVRRYLKMNGSILAFRDLKTLNQPEATFRISNVSGSLHIWDVTTPQTPFRQAFSQNGGTAEFGATTLGTLRNFVAWTDASAFPKPEVATGKIANQNLHGLQNLHMAIIYHPEFESQALRLAEHRRSYSGLDVATVNVQQLFNEFSSGGKDPTAIRDFARMLLERDPGKFEYLLLFGDGSFDPKNNSNGADNNDFIPVFETAESFSPINAFPSDDYFGLLSPDEGGALTGALDISVGRLVPRSADEAEALTNKIIAYDQDPALLGDWHLRVLFIADDEDGNAHINQADKLSIDNANAEEWFNNEKVYFDAYQQVATSAGQRFPDAKAAINSNIFKGNLITHYIGHGGPRGWSQERVIDNNDIANWDNPNKYPLIITATCTFGGYDDYTTLTGGEQALLRVNSGAVALFTTVRSVYINGNEDLTDAVQSIIFKRLNGKYRAIGRILKDAKNKLSSDIQNARRFTLLGDPAMLLAMPEYRVATTGITGPNGPVDTLRALMPVTLTGMVTDTLGNQINTFNGKVFVTLFDKAQKLETLVQDPTSQPKEFFVQRNVIFKGLATVNNGQFSINFIVPKDIKYEYGLGKISYYAENGTPLDAAGADRTVVIGGNAGLIQDNTPPLVQAFLNTDAFAFGGITDNAPKVLVKCSDDYGMNVSGASLGHDLTAVLDGNILETIVLNEFYQSAQDDARKGQAIYPLNNLTPGKHTLAVKGWDVANNSGEGYTEFVVAEDGKAALDHVLNFPNPFTTNTYFQFEHNLAGQVLDVQVSIFSVAGKLVKTIQQTLANNDGYRVTDIQWDGKDEYGDQLARGVYLYRVKVRGTDATGNASTAESEFEKLVILK